MSEATEGFSPLELLPADAPLGMDEDLNALVGSIADPDEDLPQPLGRGWAFDFETGQFLRHGSSPAVVRDLDNLRVWIEKTLRTHRGAHAIYTDAYGSDMPHQGVGEQFSPEVVGSLSTAIESALLAHDRIEEVADLRFTGDEATEVLFVDFTVLVDDEELTFVELPLGESY
jgi:hypothetical protein